MKIAVIVPVLRKISQNNTYGGIERIAMSLIIGAADAGHQITLYAPFGTDLKHKNLVVRLTTDQDILGKSELIQQAEINLFKRVFQEQSEFDLIHTHIEPMIAEDSGDNYFANIVTPIVATMHNLSYIQNNIEYYKLHQNIHHVNYVFISQDQSKPLDFLPKQAVIYNGINIDEISFSSTPNDGQLCFLGRITPEKGIIQAIDIVKQSNKKLLIAAAIDDSQIGFFDTKVKPMINGKQIIYLGEVDNTTRDDLLRTSEALLFPIQWHEPFGLVMVEAMAAGTPVVASNIGSVPEIVENGKNGYVISDINDINEYSEKIARIDDIDREYCRKIVEEKFTDKIMVSKYLSHYNHIKTTASKP
jgi:glycosyltransferase involved in cell wall biosynthesis